MKLTSSDEINSAISRIWREGGEQKLAELVDAEFDDLAVFSEGARAEHVNEAAGFELIGEKFYVSSKQLFMFRLEGVATSAVMVSADVFLFEEGEGNYGPDVAIVGAGGEELIRLVD